VEEISSNPTSGTIAEFVWKNREKQQQQNIGTGGV
jgi:hypothetical protein